MPNEDDNLSLNFNKLFSCIRPSVTEQTEQSEIYYHPAMLPGPVQSKKTQLNKHVSSYKMDHPQRGLAIIFNHFSFRNGRSQREGSDVDENALKEQFSRLNFKVIIERDRSKDEIKGILASVAKINHADSDCLVIVVMTHGDSKKLSAHDKSYKVSQLWKPFLGQNCPSLIGKPKLFFIQACRGAGTDDGVTVKARGALVDSFPILANHSSMPNASYKIPNTADLLISYATYEGQYAWRDPIAGSWYIQSLCKELREHGETHEILQIMTAVNRRVAIEYESFQPGDPQMHLKKQMPNFLSSLTGQVIFSPKGKVTQLTETEI